MQADGGRSADSLLSIAGSVLHIFSIRTEVCGVRVCQVYLLLLLQLSCRFMYSSLQSCTPVFWWLLQIAEQQQQFLAQLQPLQAELQRTTAVAEQDRQDHAAATQRARCARGLSTIARVAR